MTRPCSVGRRQQRPPVVSSGLRSPGGVTRYHANYFIPTDFNNHYYFVAKLPKAQLFN